MAPNAQPGVPVQGSDDYELVPRTQIEYLRSEVEKLRRNPFGDSKSSKDVLTALDDLNVNVRKLVAIFETANDEIVRDYKDRANTERMNRVVEQNEKLAKGIVTIAELLKEMKIANSALNAAGGAAPVVPSPVVDAPGVPNPVVGRPGPQYLPEDDGPQWQSAAPEQPPQGVPYFGPQQGPRKLPPINFSDVPPPPPR